MIDPFYHSTVHPQTTVHLPFYDTPNHHITFVVWCVCFFLVRRVAKTTDVLWTASAQRFSCCHS